MYLKGCFCLADMRIVMPACVFHAKFRVHGSLAGMMILAGVREGRGRGTIPDGADGLVICKMHRGHEIKTRGWGDTNWEERTR